MRPFVSAVVLAAGASSRLGQPKQVLPFGSTTLLGAVVATARAASAVDEVVVVLGGGAEDVRRQVALEGAVVVENPSYGEGCATSYRTAIGALDPRAEAMMVLLGDEPGVEGAAIDGVIGQWRATRDRILLAAYRDGEGHPLVFDRELFARLAGLAGDKAAWKIVDAHREWVRAVPMDRPRPRGVNTWQDYEALRHRE